jgi:hypothetical protein
LFQVNQPLNRLAPATAAPAMKPWAAWILLLAAYGREIIEGNHSRQIQ